MKLRESDACGDRGWDVHCPTCGMLVPDLARVRAENEALKKQLEEARGQSERAAALASSGASAHGPPNSRAAHPGQQT
jgi:hypothetical protein